MVRRARMGGWRAASGVSHGRTQEARFPAAEGAGGTQLQHARPLVPPQTPPAARQNTGGPKDA